MQHYTNIISHNICLLCTCYLYYIMYRYIKLYYNESFEKYIILFKIIIYAQCDLNFILNKWWGLHKLSMAFPLYLLHDFLSNL